MSGILRHTQGKRRIVVDYDLMLESPSLQIKRIANAISLPFDELCQQRLDLFENEFVNRNLRHHIASQTKLKHSESVPDYVKDAYVWMLKLAKDIDRVEDGESYRVEFLFSCHLTSGVYFMNAGVLGYDGQSEIYLKRVIDIIAFKVLPETSYLGIELLLFVAFCCYARTDRI